MVERKTLKLSEWKNLGPDLAMPKRRAESPVARASSSSPSTSPELATSSLPPRQSKRRKVTDAGASQQAQKKAKSSFNVLRKKTLKAKLAATVTIQVKPKGKNEPAPPTPVSLSEHVELPTKAEEELELLRKQLTEKDEQIQAQKQALSAIHQQVQCQICLDTFIRPYSLVPCGHVACLGCLQQWFRAPGPDTDAQPPSQIIVRRKKTCPHCRALVVQRPVAAFLIKEVIIQVESALNPNAAPTLNATDSPRKDDPWNDIFPTQFNGARHAMGGAIIDHEDGGVRRCNNCLTEIFHGVCQGCGETYDFYDNDSEESEIELGIDPMPYVGYFPAFGEHANLYEEDEGEDDGYESDFVVNDDILELFNDGNAPDEDHEEHPFFHPVAQQNIEISDDSDDESDEEPILLRRYHRNVDHIVVSDDGLPSSSSIEMRAPGMLHEEMGAMTDDEEEVVNWELQHSPMVEHDYDEDTEEIEDTVPENYDEYEDAVVPGLWGYEEESTGYYSDQY